jgi:hypothetical protein
MSKERTEEIQKSKMEEKATQAATQVMHLEMKRVLSAHDEGLTEKWMNNRENKQLSLMRSNNQK